MTDTKQNLNAFRMVLVVMCLLASIGAFAGMVTVYGQLVDAIAKKLSGDPDTNLTFDSLYEYVMREVVKRSTWVSHGSSQSGYLYKRCETAAWAKALDYIQTGM